jgi:hypothetical protein
VSDPFAPLVRALAARAVRYVLIGLGGANLYTPRASVKFVTYDYDLFLPLDPDNLVHAWGCCDESGLELWLNDEPLDRPRDRWLAERIVERRAVTRATGPDELVADLTLVMKGFEFESVWTERRLFKIEGVDVPTARLLHIVQSKEASGRDKDRLFLATHRDALEQLLKKTELD